MMLDTIIEKEKTALEEGLMWMFPRKQGKVAKQMKLYDSLSVIGEIKKASPGKSVIVEDFSATRFTNTYDETGINAILILTERNFLQGGLENIEIARFTSDLPILCKDFTMGARRVTQTKRIGANTMLLIVAMLDDAALCEFYQLACFLDLEYIVEVYNEKELERASQLQPEIIGINSRGLCIFVVFLGTTKRLASGIPADISIVSEGGISVHEGMEYVRKAGADAVLIRESLMCCPGIRTHLRELKCDSRKAARRQK